MENIQKIEDKLQDSIKHAYEGFFGGHIHFGPRLGFQGMIKGFGITTQVSMTGTSVQGALVLEGSAEACQNISKEMLGLSEISEEDALDGFGELGNMLGGTLKSTLGQEGIIFNIGIPQVQKPETDSAKHTISLMSKETVNWIHQPIIIKGQNLSIYLTYSVKKTQKSDQPKILVIEDDPVSGKALIKQLQQLNYEVLLATDALSGIQIAVSEKCDMVITDISLPQINGAAAVAALQVILPQTHILVCSSLPEEEIREKLGHSADHVKAILNKPVSKENLLKEVQSCLASPETASE